MSLQFHNQLSKKVDLFTPQVEGKVSLYTCGPTVYNYLHIGNWTAYIYWDTLVRVLQANNLDIDRVMNITDVGHLVSDADDGEDKLEKGARREGKTAWEVAAFYTDDFLKGMERLGLIAPTHITKATDFIEEQLELVRVLKNKGFTYTINDGIYFDTAKFPTYGDFAGLDLEAQKAGARVEFNPEKRNPSDFALWKFTPSGETRDMEWETPLDLVEPIGFKSEETPAAQVSAGVSNPTETRSEAVSEDLETNQATSYKMGFPGWHLECSAMAMSLLGETLDLHTGGIDHIPVHHTNEIAQSEAATGKIFANYWMHNNHLKVNGTKISKSLDNGYTLDDLDKKGYSPLDFRMFVLQSHYRSEGNFTFENLDAAKNRLRNWRNIAALRHQTHDRLRDDDEKSTDDESVSLYASSQALVEALSNDLDTPTAFAIIDEAFSKIESIDIEDIHQHALTSLLETIDSVLGLQLLGTTKDISDDSKRLIIERERARENKDWKVADQLRDQIEKSGITVRDTAHGSIWEYTA
jgi:cysteinyl-tRNA synthetase